MVTAILQGMVARGHGDLVVELGDVVPVKSIFFLLGIEDTGERKIFELNRKMLGSFDNAEERAQYRRRMAAWAGSKL